MLETTETSYGFTRPLSLSLSLFLLCCLLEGLSYDFLRGQVPRGACPSLHFPLPEYTSKTSFIVQACLRAHQKHGFEKHYKQSEQQLGWGGVALRGSPAHLPCMLSAKHFSHPRSLSRSRSGLSAGLALPFKKLKNVQTSLSLCLIYFPIFFLHFDPCNDSPQIPHNTLQRPPQSLPHNYTFVFLTIRHVQIRNKTLNFLDMPGIKLCVNGFPVVFPRSILEFLGKRCETRGLGQILHVSYSEVGV